MQWQLSYLIRLKGRRTRRYHSLHHGVKGGVVRGIVILHYNKLSGMTDSGRDPRVAFLNSQGIFIELNNTDDPGRYHVFSSPFVLELSLKFDRGIQCDLRSPQGWKPKSG